MCKKNKISIVLRFIVLFISIHQLAFGQVSISGKIYDAKTNQAVEGVDVFLSNTSIIAYSDHKGRFVLKNIKPGEYTLSTFYPGMESINKNIKIENQDIEINLILTPFQKKLDEVVVTAEKNNSYGIARLNAVEGMAIYEGKKNEIIKLADITGNKATNNTREIYAKVPGLNIWESDGAGLQLGIGARGLSPNRTANFNTRQNGYDISADAIGYPESYYTPPVESLERIEVVRGAASLQYGPQFGGMINFVFKRGEKGRPFDLTARQTVGSFGLSNTFVSLAGETHGLDYFAYFQHKTGNGWRPNSGFDQNTAFIDLNYQITKKFFLCFEYTFMNYLAQQPGGLTDNEFLSDPRQSKRERNWFRVNWNLAALIFEYKFSDNTKINIRNFGLLAERDALGLLSRIDRDDNGEKRDLISDDFKNWGSEARLIQYYNLLDQKSVLLVGGRYYHGNTHKMQGLGSDGRDADFNFDATLLKKSDYTFPGINKAFFAENIFTLSPRLSITPGARYENIQTFASGYFTDSGHILDNDGFYVDSMFTVNETRSNKRSFFLLGVGYSYKLDNGIEAYGNFSQNYRGVTFTDMRIVNPNQKVDLNLKDENGYNVDMGFRGNWKKLVNFDASIFYMNYNNRIGFIDSTDEKTYTLFKYRTNTGKSFTYGLEALIEADLFRLFIGKNLKSTLFLFQNFSLLDAKYSKSEEAGVAGKKVELVPAVTYKTGLTFKRNNFKASYQFSYTASQYTDASNAKTPETNGVNGLIPSYYVMDLGASYTYKKFTFEAGSNNITNNMYFTRRAEAYPGPGVIPSDGRSFYVALQMRLYRL